MNDDDPRYSAAAVAIHKLTCQAAELGAACDGPTGQDFELARAALAAAPANAYGPDGGVDVQTIAPTGFIRQPLSASPGFWVCASCMTGITAGAIDHSPRCAWVASVRADGSNPRRRAAA